MSSASARSTGTSDHLPAGPRRGPRTDAGAARSAILTAARSLFQQMDYQSVSMRAIARTGRGGHLVGELLLRHQAGALPADDLAAQRSASHHCRGLCVVEHRRAGGDTGTFLPHRLARAGHGGSGRPDSRKLDAGHDPGTAAGTRCVPQSARLLPAHDRRTGCPSAGYAFRRAGGRGASRLAVTICWESHHRTIVGLDALRHLPDDELIAREAPTLQTILTGSLPSSAPIDDVWKDNPGPANTVPRGRTP